MSGWFFDKNAISQANPDGKYVGLIEQANVEVAVIDDHLWVSTGTNLQVWNIWGSVDKDELATQELYDLERNPITDQNYPWFRSPVKIFDQAITGGISKFADGGDRVYLLSTDKMNVRWIKKDLSNYDTLDDPVTLPVAMNSEMVFAYGKIWLVSDMDERKNNHLYLINGTSYSKINIDSKGQSTYNRLIDGQNGFVYVARFEEGILSKFAGSTGAWTADVQVNAQPYGLGISSDGYISYVAYSGCVSYINRSTDAVTHPYGLMEPITHIVDLNDGYIWGKTADNQGIIRLKKSDQKVIFTDPGFDTENQDDYKIELTGIGEDTSVRWRQMLMSPTRTAQFWNGSSMSTVTVYPRLFLVTSSKIYIIRMKDTLHRKPYIDLKAYGYITTFENDYSGG